MTLLKPIKTALGISLLLFAVSCVPAEDPALPEETTNPPVEQGNLVVTIYSPVENQVYAVREPHLEYLVEDLQAGGSVADSRVAVAVHDIDGEQRIRSTSVSTPANNTDLPALADGSHELEFTVNGEDGSPMVTVNIRFATNTQVAPPVAVAGLDETVRPGNTVSLSGTESYSAGGYAIASYLWEIVSAPEGSQATLSDATAVNAAFVPDLPGVYVIKLVVTDSQGTVSVADTVTITTNNSAPVADAGLDGAVTTVGQIVQLDASQSYDPDGDGIFFKWTFASKPAGSNAEFSDDQSPSADFVVDAVGDYKVSLVVTDDFDANSQPALVTFSFNNLPPVAQAAIGESSVPVGTAVFIDGTGSFDPNGDTLTYRWVLATRPEGSETALDAVAGEDISFTPDTAGTYVVSLTVNDGTVDSKVANVTVVAVVTENSTPVQILWEALAVIDGLDGDAFRNRQHRGALTNKVLAVVEKLDKEDFEGAVEQLRNDIIRKTNGCHLTGHPGWNDWIKRCDAQGQLHPLLDGALVALDPAETTLGEPEGWGHGRYSCIREALRHSHHGREFFHHFGACIQERYEGDEHRHRQGNEQDDWDRREGGDHQEGGERSGG